MTPWLASIFSYFLDWADCGVNGRSEVTHFRTSKIDPGWYGEE
jgi:hypothetical protein